MAGEKIDHDVGFSVTALSDYGVYIALNRPKTANAFDAALIAALTQEFKRLAKDENVRVVFLGGTGRNFCAGGDLAWMKAAAEQGADANLADARALADLFHAWWAMPMLTVGLVDGTAFGGGAGLVAASDHVIATREARFCFSEARLGLAPATISPYVISAIGARAARALFASAIPFSAEYALRLGLIAEMVPGRRELDQKMADLLAHMGSVAPNASRMAKALVADFAQWPPTAGLIDESAKKIAHLRTLEEAKAGLSAFLEKIDPPWKPKTDGKNIKGRA